MAAAMPCWECAFVSNLSSKAIGEMLVSPAFLPSTTAHPASHRVQLGTGMWCAPAPAPVPMANAGAVSPGPPTPALIRAAASMVRALVMGSVTPPLGSATAPVISTHPPTALNAWRVTAVLSAIFCAPPMETLWSAAVTVPAWRVAVCVNRTGATRRATFLSMP